MHYALGKASKSVFLSLLFPMHYNAGNRLHSTVQVNSKYSGITWPGKLCVPYHLFENGDEAQTITKERIENTVQTLLTALNSTNKRRRPNQ